MKILMISICCVCHKEYGKKYVEVENNYPEHLLDDGKLLSHGYCDECFETAIKQINNNTTGSTMMLAR